MKDIKKIESVEDGVKLVLEDDSVVTVKTENDEFKLTEADEEDDFEAATIDELIKEIESRYGMTEEQEDELKQNIADKLTESEDEDESKTESEDEEKAMTESEDEDEAKTESEDEDEVKTEADEDEVKTEACEDEAKTESDEEEKEFKLSEELDDLLEVDLSDEIKEKIDLAFDTIVKEKTSKLKEELEKENEKELTESIKVLEKAVSLYVEQAANAYIKSNKLALTEGLRIKYFESFFSKLKALFKENYVDLDENEEEIVADLKKENDELKNKADELVNEVSQLQESVVKLKREKEINSIAKDMYLTESERFKSASDKLLTESAKMSDATFTKKLSVIAELFKSSPKQKKSTKVLSEGFVKNEQKGVDDKHPDVKALLENW